MKIEDCMAYFQIPKYLHYMDSAATSLIPEPVIASMNEYDRQYRANVGRGMHRLTRVATQKYQDAHDSISSFIGGKEGTTVPGIRQKLSTWLHSDWTGSLETGSLQQL